jgi:group I intron endonuclease
MSGKIYRLTNNINGMKYIGQTFRTIEERFREHCGNSRTSVSPKLKNAIKKYESVNFTIEVIWECNGDCTVDELDAKEIELISTENTMHPNGYNLTKGGSGGRHSDETKKIISEKSKKAWEENGEKWRAAAKERGRTEDQKARTSATLIKLFSENPGIKQKISEAHKGKKKSDETRERMKDAMQVRMQNPEFMESLRSLGERLRKKVYQFNQRKELVAIHESLTSSTKDTGISMGKIRYSIANGTVTDGFCFSYSSSLPAVSAAQAVEERSL